MKSLSLRAMALWLSLSAAVLGGLLLLLDPLVLQTLRNQAYDQYQRWSPRTYEPVPVRIIDIDEASLERLGQWPWPRTRIADMVTRLNDVGAAAIGFDVVFAEPDRTSPRAVVDLWPLAPPIRQALSRLPDHDAMLGEALVDRPVVLGFAVQRDRDPGEADRLPAAPYRYVWVGGGPRVDALHGFSTAVPALDVLNARAAGNGALTFVPDADGVVRRVPLALRLGDQPVPTLASETLRVGLGARNHLLRSAESDVPALQEVRIGDITVPTTAQGEMWVHYTEPVPERYVPAWQVLDGSADPALLAGHLVLVGSSAQGLMDLRFNPLGRIMPGVEAHAQALEQALSGHFLTRPAWALGMEVVVLALGTVVLVVLATYVRALWAAAGAVLMIGGVLVGGWWAFAAHGLLLNSLTPALVLALAFVVASLAHHFWSEQQQRFIKQAFSRYVSPNRVDYLVQHPDDLNLGGQRQTCSFIFTDLAGFTSLMYDGSRKPLAQNIDETAQIAEMAHAAGISCEGEIGFVGYSGGENSAGTDPAEAAIFARDSGVDAMAISVGNVHLQTDHEGGLDEARIRAIEAVTDVALVIHGGSGVPYAQRAALAAGSRIAKFNIGTELRMAFGAALRAAINADPARFDRVAILKETHDPVMEAARAVIRGLGASGRA